VICDHPIMTNWTITFVLLSLVSAIFSFVGTLSAGASLFGRVAAVGFLLCALVILFIRREHHDHR